MSAIKLLGLDSIQMKQSEISKNQDQTKSSFSFKWSKKETYESESMQKFIQSWFHEKYLGGDINELDRWLGSSPKLILEAGCGSGNSALLLFGKRLNDHHYLGIDISDAIEVAKQRFQAMQVNGDFLQVDLMDIPVPDETFDIIFSEGVLHHTDSTENAIKYLSDKLKVGGKFLFYVYAKKSVIREFTDDFVRQALVNMTDEQAWEALKPLTKLGRALGDLNIELDIDADIPILGIKKGKFNLQRFFYWNILKTYYRPEFSIDEMNHINFDWFRPLNCHRHTQSEIESYCKKANLKIEIIRAEEAGFTVIAEKVI
jgi:SAM-dependent methyltransferase